VTVTVSSSAGTPTGSVSLSVDGGAATAQGLASGATSFTISSPSPGSHALYATYSAQGNFGASSASGTLGVGLGATSILLSAPPITYGSNGMVTVTVSSNSGTPTGSVSLSVDGGAATAQGLASGATTFIILGPNAGTHTLSATYGDAQGNFGPSSTTGTLDVNQAATTTNISAPAISNGSNGSVTVTVSSSAGIPTGSVSLIVDGGAPLIKSLSSGYAIFIIHKPSVGIHTLDAIYAEQGNFGGSSSTNSLSVGT
jgi:hypothetical protein